MITTGFNGTDVNYGYMGTPECEAKEDEMWIQWELEKHDFDQEGELFLDEVQLKTLEETCTYEDWSTAGDYTVVDGPGWEMVQQMGWNGNWQGLGANGTGRRDPITTANSVVRRGQDHTGFGSEGNHRTGDEKISFVPDSYFVQGRTEVIGDSSLPPIVHHNIPPPPTGFPAFSICIPHVFSNIRERRIRSIFRRLGYPNIESIDFVPIRREPNGHESSPANKVFVHFFGTPHCSPNPIINRSINMILRGESVKITYDDPWFWKIAKSRSHRKSKHIPAPPRIDF